MRSASPLQMWAVIIRTKRTEWIHWHTIRMTRKGAWEAYLQSWIPEHHDQCRRDRKSGKIRLAKITASMS